MHVQMRDALADAIVNAHKRPLGCERLLHRLRQELGIRKERADQRPWQVDKGLVVTFGN